MTWERSVDDVERGAQGTGVRDHAGVAPGRGDTTSSAARAHVAMEALLFAAGSPVALARLAALLEMSEAAAREAADQLALDLRGRGIRLVRNGDELELATSPDLAPIVRRLTEETRKVKLSHAALETLAIIAYRQPVTRAQIETIRGVNSDRAIATLLSHDVIEEAGRLEAAGRPVLYRTTLAFLERFGLGSLDDLPPLEPAAHALVKQNGAEALASQEPPPRPNTPPG